MMKIDCKRRWRLGKRGNLDKVLEEMRPFERQKALGMELHAVELPGLVPHPHDLTFGGPGADDKIRVVKRLALDNEAVIARRLERIGQAAKDALIVVVNHRRLAVH